MKFCAVFFCILLLLAWNETRFLPDGRLHVHVFDVGQGDAILLQTPSGQQIVVDGGPNQDLLEHLSHSMPFLDRKIELVILSHPDADHITALPELVQRYDIGAILMTGAQHGSGRYEEFITHINQLEIPVLIADPQEDIDMGDGVILDVLWPHPDVFGRKTDDPNNLSVVVKVLFGEESLLLTGDIEEPTEMGILADGADVSATILKVPHHGSRTSSSTGFLLAVDPDLALISAGRENKFGHPHEDVLLRYEQFGIDMLSTQILNSLEISMPRDY